VRLLRIADLCDAKEARLRARNFSQRRWKRSNWYELALECLAELIGDNTSLVGYLDRSFSPNLWEFDADREGVPRIKYHTENVLSQPEEATIKTTKQLKWEALEKAIEALSAPPAVSTKRNPERLRPLKSR
jgi:hypothetical protein